MFQSSAPLTRRSALRSAARTGLVAALGAGSLASLSGCADALDRLRAPSPSAPAPSTPADRALVDEVVATLREAFATAPQPFRRLHRAHLTALHAKAGQPAATAPAAGVVRRRERALPETLADAAVRAESPDLVRLLASMAAGQRQLLALHPGVTA